MNKLVAHGLVKRYKKRNVVDNVSLQLNTGEIVGLLGPNGAGKTTCFYMMVGLIKCEEGQITLNDREITHFPMHARARAGVGYLPQEPSIFRKMTVAENILAVLETRRQLSSKQRLQKLRAIMKDLNIEKLKNSQGISLSGGERRRVEIARALAMEPRFMLLDEPFAGVDPISIGDIQRIIKHLTQLNIGILITDHNVRETLGICNRAYILNEGKIISAGSPKIILQNQKVRDVYLGDEFKL